MLCSGLHISLAVLHMSLASDLYLGSSYLAQSHVCSQRRKKKKEAAKKKKKKGSSDSESSDDAPKRGRGSKGKKDKGGFNGL